MRQLRLLGPRILVRRLPAPDTTPSGLWVPTYWVEQDEQGNTINATGRELPALGHVVALGRYRTGIPLPLALGDLIQFPKFHQRRVFLDGEYLLELRMDEVLVRIEM